MVIALLRSEPADVEILLPSVAAYVDERLGGDFSPLTHAILAHGLRLGNVEAVREALLGEYQIPHTACSSDKVL